MGKINFKMTLLTFDLNKKRNYQISVNGKKLNNFKSYQMNLKKYIKRFYENLLIKIENGDCLYCYHTESF